MAVVVFDAGKTNVKLLFIEADGTMVHEVATDNIVVMDGPFRRHDLAATEAWMFEQLRAVASEIRMDAFICSGHGSAGVLIADDDLKRPEPLSPMIDYEQSIEGALQAAYASQAEDFFDRGSAIMLGATHQARQMLWVQKERPDLFDRATAFVGLPQYWAWRMSGIAASEISYLAAQSGLWNLKTNGPSQIVSSRDWHRLMPPRRTASDTLGTLRPELANTMGLPANMQIKVGVHDSSANFYYYQALGFKEMRVVSTGTWIVGMTDKADLSMIDPARGMICGADIAGNKLIGVLSMAGRAFARIAGAKHEQVSIREEDIAGIVAGQTMALPTFGPDDALFPGTAEKGVIIGPEPATPTARKALAILYSAMQTSECLGVLGESTEIILDGAYVNEPLYGPLLSALMDGRDIKVNQATSGVALGAALLAMDAKGHQIASQCTQVTPLAMPALKGYADQWRRAARNR